MINSPELKVGLFVVTIALLIGFMSLQVTEGPGGLLGSRTHWFIIPSAGGLVKNSAVTMAGIKIGVIEDIKLTGGQAKIIVKLKKDIPITASSQAVTKSDGILGDKHVEITPGGDDEPRLENGVQILIAKESGSLGDIAGEIGKITGSIGELAEVLKTAATGQGDSSTPIGRIILNIEKLTADLSQISGQNKEKINEIVDQVHGITKTVDELVNDEGPEGFRTAWGKAVDSLSRIDRSLKNIEEITEKVNNGEGTIGKLINDDTTVNNLNTAIEGVSNFVGGANTMETSLDFQTYGLSKTGETKSYLAARIQPGLDRYYEIGIVDDPKGVTKITDTTIDANPGGFSENTTTTTHRNKLKITALFAKNFYNFSLKGGMIENSGGVGMDYHFFRKKFRFSLEGYEFSDFKLRAGLRYNILRGVFVTAGGEDLNDPVNREGFIGAGIFITNDDLKLFASQLAF